MVPRQDGAKLSIYEKVVVKTDHPKKAHLNGCRGAVLGSALSEDGRWSYAVHMYDENKTWSFEENELVATGEHDKRETFYGDDPTRIRVNKDGRVRGLPDSPAE
jgi:hypothetical protein